MFRSPEIIGIVTNHFKMRKRLSCTPEKQPHTHSGCKKHGQPTDRGKLGLIFVLAELDFAIGEKTSQILRIKSRLTESMINQLRLVKRTFDSNAENPANPAVSIIPHKAIRPVKVSAISNNGF